MQTFVTLHYREIEGELTRPAFSPNYKALHVPFWRCLRLYVWRLERSAKQWSQQLTAYCREQPVFAMLGGQVDGA